MSDPRIRPLTDPTPYAPSAENIDTSALPKYARTKEEWWQIVDCIWPAIVDIMRRVGHSTDDINAAHTLKANRDNALAATLNRVWGDAPDAYFIHSWPQWGRLCDLCSECGVLEE